MRISRQDCLALDAKDPLASLAEQFLLPEGVIYLDGNSLGALPRHTPDRIAKAVQGEWGTDLIRSWGTAGWFDLPTQLGDRVGALVGAAPGQTVVCDTTSINIYKALRSAMALRPDRNVIVSEANSFPTDLYMTEGAARAEAGRYERRLVGRDGGTLTDVLSDDVAVVLLSNIDYRTGAVHDMQAVTRQVRDAGALMVWDLCHSAGVLPMELDACQVDFAVGCTYKYLNGGPGAPAFIYVADRHINDATQPLSGWWGHAAPFAFEQDFRPTDGIRRFLCGTQPILSMTGLAASMDIFDTLDMQTVRRKSQSLTGLFIDLVDQHPGCQMLELASPRDASVRGSQVSYAFENGYPVVRAMIEKGVIGDFRAPDIMRFGLAPYYLSHADIYDAVEIMADCIAREVWLDERYTEMETVT